MASNCKMVIVFRYQIADAKKRAIVTHRIGTEEEALYCDLAMK
jgi:hypothetical protein